MHGLLVIITLFLRQLASKHGRKCLRLEESEKTEEMKMKRELLLFQLEMNPQKLLDSLELRDITRINFKIQRQLYSTFLIFFSLGLTIRD